MRDDFDKMGLVLGTKGRMYYGYKHGWGGWLPRPIKHGVSLLWNIVVCWRIGHDEFTYPNDSQHPGETWCVSCDKRLK